MSRNLKFFAILICLCHALLQGKVVKLNQKEGIWQDKKEKQIDFVSFERVNFDFDKVPLKNVANIALHNNDIFILDSKRNELYVIDKKGNYLYTIGRPGQGPGDLEYACDFLISDDEKVYVLNSMPKRIEIFDIKGKPIETIRLDIPGFGVLPESIMVGNGQNFIISSSFGNLIAIYDKNGSHKKTLLNKSDIESYKSTPSVVGIPSKIKMLNNNILHFGLFKGVFTELDLSGNIIAEFSAYEDRIYKDSLEIEDEYKNTENKDGPTTNVTFRHFTSFCIDQFNRIYMVPVGRKKGEIQKLFVFSPYGNLLYKKPLDFFYTMPVKHICCEKDIFVFGTHDLNLIIAYRRKK